MAKIERFEDIEAWQDARTLVRNLYAATAQGSFVKDLGLQNQLRRAAVSIMSNIAEGFERQSNKELIHYLYIAKGSAAEVRSQVYVASDLGYLSDAEANEISEHALVVSRKLFAFIRYLKDHDSKKKQLTNRPAKS